MLNWNSRQRAAPKIVKLRVFPLSAVPRQFQHRQADDKGAVSGSSPKNHKEISQQAASLRPSRRPQTRLGEWRRMREDD